MESLTDLFAQAQQALFEAVVQPLLFSLGFGKPTSKFVFGSTEKAFGWPGLGGSFGFADPDTGIGYGYVLNKLGYHAYSDPRELALRQALFRDVLGARPQA